MAVVLLPVVEGAAEALGPVLLRAGAALLGGAALAGTASLSGDKAKDQSKAKPIADKLSRTDESCKKCPPEQTGHPEKLSHSMSRTSREYQGRITGRPYSVEDAWSEEWVWEGIDFDGFIPGECLLQEAKARYDKFLDEDDEPLWFFRGFDNMTEQLEKQATIVKANPPARLMWYFMTPRAREYMLPKLTLNGVSSVCEP